MQNLGSCSTGQEQCTSEPFVKNKGRVSSWRWYPAFCAIWRILGRSLRTQEKGQALTYRGVLFLAGVIYLAQQIEICRGAIMIYLMRHGADPSERYGGWSAYGLTEKGREQVHSAKGNLYNKGITQIYSSDLVRAKETAEIVANSLSLEITYLPQFRESNNGLLAGMLKTEAAEKYPGMYWNALGWTETWPKGESPEQFFHRIQSAWYEFKKQVGKSNVLLVSHGGVMNIILCLENGIPYTNKETRFQIKEAEIVQMDI